MLVLIFIVSVHCVIIMLFFLIGQIHNRYEGKDISNHKRNLVIAGGVSLSAIVSPVVAAVTVGQSAPTLLIIKLSV